MFVGTDTAECVDAKMDDPIKAMVHTSFVRVGILVLSFTMVYNDIDLTEVSGMNHMMCNTCFAEHGGLYNDTQDLLWYFVSV